MKVLLMGNNDHMGGLIVHYISLVKFLNKYNYELLCININDKKNKIFPSGEVNEIQVSFKPTNFFGKVKKALQLQYAIKKSKEFKPDIFISVGLGNGFVKVSKHLPSSTFKVFQEVIHGATLNPLRENALNVFDAVATQTPGMCNIFKKNVSDKIPVGFLPCFAKEYVQNTSIYLNKKIIRLAYFGRLAPNKGLAEFILSCENILKEYDVLLDIYGKGAEQDRIINIVETCKLGHKVTLKGFYSDTDFPDLISSYHSVILPSINNEGLPLVVLESMFFGKPMFTTDIGAIPEVASLNPFIFISSISKNSLSKDFELFINELKENDLIKIGEKIKEIYENHFSSNAFEKIWLNMLTNPRKYFEANGY